MAELFELHDKAKFELLAFDNGWGGVLDDVGSSSARRTADAFFCPRDYRWLIIGRQDVMLRESGASSKHLI